MDIIFKSVFIEWLEPAFLSFLSLSFLISIFKLTTLNLLCLCFIVPFCFIVTFLLFNLYT